MVTKGIPWSSIVSLPSASLSLFDMPCTYAFSSSFPYYFRADLPAKHRGEHEYVPAPEPAPERGETEEKNLMNDAKAIVKRAAFGMVSGSIAGASFGFVDVLRDTKAMSQRKSVVTSKVLQYTYKCGGIFAGYHAARKTLKLYDPTMSGEVNVMTAMGITMTPLVALKALRPMAPYALVLVLLDCLNGINDI